MVMANNTTEQPSLFRNASHDQRIRNLAQGGFLSFTTFLGIMGNSLVLCVTWRGRGNLSRYKLLLAHLAFSDLLFSIFQIFEIVPLFRQCWCFGAFLCKLVPSVMTLASLLAINTVVVIAYERYKGLLNPLKRRSQRSLITTGLSIVWIVSVASVVPRFLALKLVGPKRECFEDWSSIVKDGSKIYTVFFFLQSFVIPSSIIATLYGRIIRSIRSSSKILEGEDGHLKDVALQRRRNQDRRAVRLIASVVIIFGLCVLPNHISWLIWEFAKKSISKSSFNILFFVISLSYPLHAAVNPIIYSIVDNKFRDEAKSIIFCTQSVKPSIKTSLDKTKCTKSIVTDL